METLSVILFMLSAIATILLVILLIISLLRKTKRAKKYLIGIIISLVLFILSIILFAIFETPETKAAAKARTEQEKQEKAEREANKEFNETKETNTPTTDTETEKSDEKLNIEDTESDTQPPEQAKDIESSDNPTPASASYEQTPLDQFICDVNLESIQQEELKDLSKKQHLAIDYKKSGAGSTEYYIAMDKKTANPFNDVNGSLITFTFDELKNGKLAKIEYFDESKMIISRWDPDNGFFMIDYNNPEEYNTWKPISSFEIATQYIPEIKDEFNKLEEFFKNVNEDMTKDDVLEMVDAYGLYYNSRGKGNEQIIACGDRVWDKYGILGSHLEIDFGDNKIASIHYFDYPAYYKSHKVASLYTDQNIYNSDRGYYISDSTANASNYESTKFNSADEMLLELHKLR